MSPLPLFGAEVNNAVEPMPEAVMEFATELSVEDREEIGMIMS